MESEEESEDDSHSSDFYCSRDPAVAVNSKRKMNSYPSSKMAKVVPIPQSNLSGVTTDMDVLPCGGCGRETGGVHRCPGCNVFMHGFCGQAVGDEGYGQKRICPECAGSSCSGLSGELGGGGGDGGGGGSSGGGGGLSSVYPLREEKRTEFRQSDTHLACRGCGIIPVQGEEICIFCQTPLAVIANKIDAQQSTQKSSRGDKEGGKDYSRVTSEKQRRALSRCTLKNPNFTRETLRDKKIRLISMLPSLTSDIRATVESDIKQVTDTIAEFSRLANMISGKNHFIFESDGDGSCLFSSVSESLFALAGYEGIPLRKDEVVRGIQTVLDRASGPEGQHSTEIKSQFRDLSSTLNGDYLLQNEYVLIAMAVSVNRPVVVASGHHIAKYSPSSALEILMLPHNDDADTYVTTGMEETVKLLLACVPGSGIQKHYNALIYLGSPSYLSDVFYSTDEREHSEQYGTIYSFLVSIGVHDAARSALKLSEEHFDEESIRLATRADFLDIGLHGRTVELILQNVALLSRPAAASPVKPSPPQRRPAGPPDIPHVVPPRCSTADADYSHHTSNTEIDGVDNDADEDNRSHTKCSKKRRTAIGFHCQADNKYVDISSSLLTLGGRVFIEHADLSLSNLAANFAAALRPASLALIGLACRSGLGGSISPAEKWLKGVQRTLGPSIARQDPFYKATGRTPLLVCLVVYNKKFNILVVNEEGAPGTCKQFLELTKEGRLHNPLCVGIQSSAFDQPAALVLDKQSKNWPRQEKRLMNRLVHHLTSLCSEDTAVGFVSMTGSSTWCPSEELGVPNGVSIGYHKSSQWRRIQNSSSVLWANPEIGEEFLTASTECRQTWLQSGNVHWGLSAFGSNCLGVTSSCSILIPTLGKSAFDVLCASVRSVNGASENAMLSIATDFLTQMGLALPTAHVSPARLRTPRASQNEYGQGSIEDQDCYHDIPKEPSAAEPARVDFESDGAINDAAGTPAVIPPQMTPNFKKYLETSSKVIQKVFEETAVDGVRIETFAMPPYNADGLASSGEPVIVEVIDGKANCVCSKNSFAQLLPSNSSAASGYENGQCNHIRAFCFSRTLSESLHALKSPKSSNSTGPFCVVLGPHRDVSSHSSCVAEDDDGHATPNPSFVHVFVRCPESPVRKKHTILTITSGHASCKTCSGTRKKNIDEDGVCCHCKYVRSVSDDPSRTDWDAQIIRSAIQHESMPSHSSLRFDPAVGLYVSNSLSEAIDKHNLDQHAYAFPVLPRIMEQIDSKFCYLSESTQGGIPMKNGILIMKPQLPTHLPPLNATTGCVYSEDTVEEERDDSGRTHVGRAYFLTFSKQVQVFDCHCTQHHPECRIRFSGHAYGFHRQSHSTMVRYEIPLLLWENNKEMKGPGASAFVAMLEKLYRLSGAEVRPELRNTCKLSLQDTAMRCSFVSFFVRHRRKFNSRCCPLCPGGICSRLVHDAKRMGVPVRYYDGETPYEIRPESEKRTVTGSITQRYFWPQDAYKRARKIAHDLASTLLRGCQSAGRLKKKDVAELVELAPAEYRDVLMMLVEYFQETGGIYDAEVAPTLSPDDELVDDDAEDDQSHHNDSPSSSSIRQIVDSEHYSVLIHTPALGIRLNFNDESSILPRIVSSSPYVGGPSIGDQIVGINRTALDNLGAEDQSRTAMRELVVGLVVGTARPITLLIRRRHRVTRAIVLAFAKQIKGICNKQCEATRWLVKEDLSVLREILDADTAGGFGTVLLATWANSDLRRSIFEAVEESKILMPRTGKFRLHGALRPMLAAMVKRVENLRAYFATLPQRILIPEGQRPKYDPSTGVAINFSASGEQVAYWPDFKLPRKTKTEERDCGCNKPGWDDANDQGLIHGIETIMCGYSGFHCGTMFLKRHEGSRDFSSAAYCFHPDLKSIKTVFNDTPCIHTTYVLNRAPHDFVDVQFTGDNWHIAPHTCFDQYTPREYAKYDLLNTSLIEQWHAIMDCLKRIAAGSTLIHAMFMLQLLHDDRYDEICIKLGVPEKKWG